MKCMLSMCTYSVGFLLRIRHNEEQSTIMLNTPQCLVQKEAIKILQPSWHLFNRLEYSL